MSWNGTVRCTYCHGQRHNRRTCPELHRQMSARLEDNPDDVYANHHFNKRTKKKKKCSYCDGYGHTRPTCKELEHAKKVAVEKCSKWRHKLVKNLRTMGLGVGALVQYKNWSAEIVGVVTEVRWYNLTHLHEYGSSEYGFVFTSMDLDRSNTRQCFLPQMENVYENNYSNPNTNFKLISPISAESFDKQVPENFLLGEDCIELVFQENEVPKYKTTWHEISDWCPKQGFYNE